VKPLETRGLKTDYCYLVLMLVDYNVIGYDCDEGWPHLLSVDMSYSADIKMETSEIRIF